MEKNFKSGMKMNGIIIQGSARGDGNTNKIVKCLQTRLSFDLIDLSVKNIGHFDYAFNNQDDDFPAIIRRIADHYDLIVFATPVYWYTMSGIMKVFFDRISDCLKIDKPTGRKLRGKKMAMLCCSSDADEIEGFAVPFQLSAQYLGMKYLGNIHTWLENGEINEEVGSRIEQFAQILEKAKGGISRAEE